jgi:hypothetical protein
MKTFLPPPKETVGKVILIVALVFINLSAQAQIRGNTSTVSKDLHLFETINEIKLDPAPKIGNDHQVQFIQKFSGEASPKTGLNFATSILKKAGINIPDEILDLADGASFFCSSFSTEFSTEAGIELGAYYRIGEMGNSAIDIRYPVKVHIVYPEKNTFACGDKIRISTRYEVLPSANKLLVKVPYFSQEIGPLLKDLYLKATIGAKADVGFGITVYYPCEDIICEKKICGNFVSFGDKTTVNLSPPISSIPIPSLINICEEGAFGPGASNATLFDCNWSAFTPLLATGQSILDNYNRSKGTNYTIASFPNENTVEIEMPDLPSTIDLTLPEMKGSFYRITNSALDYEESPYKLSLSGKKSLFSKMEVDLISFIDYTGHDTSWSLGGGKGEFDLGDASPTLTVEQNMSFDFSPVVHLLVDIEREMVYSVYNKDGTLSHSSKGRLVKLTAGQYIEAIFPGDCSDPLFSNGKSNLGGSFSSLIEHDYYSSLSLRVGEVDFPLFDIDFSLIDKNILKSKFDNKTIVDHSFTINSDNISPIPSFYLDPENPIITIESLEVADVVNLGKGERGIVYKMKLKNDGDVTLNQLRLDFDLAEIFKDAEYFSVECISSDDFTANGFFNGTTDKNLLGRSNSLSVSKSGIIELLVKVKPQISGVDENGCFSQIIYNARADAYGVSPIGTHVKNNYNQCTQKVTGPDIIASVDLGAAVLESVYDYTIYGWKEVKLSKPQGAHYGHIGSGGDIIFENNSYQNTDPLIVVGDIHAGGQLFLQGQSVLEVDYVSLVKDIKSPNWKSSMIVNGAVSEFSSCTFIQQPLTLDFNAGKGTRKIQVKRNESMELEPGDYNTVTMLEGSQLIMSSGVYNIGKWVFLGDNAQVKYKLTGEPVMINLETWQPLRRANLKFMIDGEGDINDILYNYSGSHLCAFSSTLLQGRIIAPNARVEFERNSELQGTCYANEVIFDSESSFKNPKFLLPLNMNPNCQDPEVSISIDDPIDKSTEITLNSEGILSGNIGIYPNPTRSSITITGLPADKPMEVKVYNSLGNLVKTLVNTSDNLNINLENQPAGIYYIMLDGSRPLKLIKM